jgi:hypothetical protein
LLLVDKSLKDNDQFIQWPCTAMRIFVLADFVEVVGVIAGDIEKLSLVYISS